MNWGVILLLSVLIVLIIYLVIPELLFHRLGIGCWKRHYGPGVSITFDDGPNPEITPQILEILARHKIKAAFFVVGERAARHPELIARIIEQEHTIGAHSQHHRHAWLMSPRTTWREWNRSMAVLEGLTGRSVEWVRPPWGGFNLATWLWMKLHGKRIVLWNAEGHDWCAGQTPEKIIARLLKKVNEGSIILLHDAGGDRGAPAHTLQALDELCRRIVEEKKLPVQELKFPDWSLARRMSFRIWEKWEHLFARMYHIQRIDAFNIFRLGRIRYQGPVLFDQDGRVLAKKGDMVAEIHMDNIRLQRKSSDPRIAAVQSLRMARESLPNLARFILNDPGYRDIQVFQGLSIIYQGARGLGFQVQEVPASWYNTIVGFLQGTVGMVYRPWGRKRRQAKMRTTVKLVWISRQALIDRWLPGDEDQA